MLVGFDDLLTSLLRFPVSVTVTVRLILLRGSLCFGNTFLFCEFEKIWLSLPVMVFISFGVASLIVTYACIGNAEEMIILLLSSQWAWRGSVIIISSVEILTNSLRLGLSGSSSDVIHSYSLWDLGVHTDCIPRKFTLHYIHSQIYGSALITCQELCRYGHSGMTVRIEW